MRKEILIFLFLGLVVYACNLEDSAVNPPSPSLLSETATYSTKVPEPSGLTLGLGKSCLWTVSDQTNHIYKLTLKGKILEELPFQGNDLEGITFDERDSTLWVAEEQLRQLVHLNTNGTELERFDVTNLEGSGNSGLEGICLGADSLFRVLNEKNPALWAKLDKDFSAVETKKISGILDLSGIYASQNADYYWIVSDQSQEFFKWSPSSGIEVSEKLNFEKAEGVAVDEERKIVYIVSDKTWKLYIYKLNQ